MAAAGYCGMPAMAYTVRETSPYRWIMVRGAKAAAI